MNQYLLLRRLKGPALLITFGITALLDQYHVLSFGKSWPLYLIVIGIFQLAERAALSRMQAPPMGGYYPPVGGVPPAPPASPGTAITPVIPGIGPEDRSR
ncbi:MULTISPECIES: DUF5668 domain-containing protein [Acidobacterium]|uniref:LiaI-LiaF-like transmembrane region domain-containing protein n=1 Tax=Acidobacterium capsulatum (strain ATCC 51196 / DSM 11244 / BCRC 80197 / JCM 7670 / NBRC 15755 / NCIMB 13165 / 161) TaxID=240015 RepID=C1F882_ACIC5|nr:MULTISPECIES: DUF5668 domain-containing protein [Acidobacterium]ACO32074.1 hypothetical protein ACP_1889 [Acidobacterium capsulatum ATCC 51196]HCT59767.1 hypothetical protein [Acidobacterium sp.]